MKRLLSGFFVLVAVLAPSAAHCQQPPFDVVPDVAPPYYRIRYEASEKEGELDLPVKYAVWIPPEVETLRGVIVHQHGCGPGSCKSGQTGTFDLQWQALAAKHDCALFAASYEQQKSDDCGRWCDPRNGSGETFLRSLVDLGNASGHPELSEIPWALWGHSGGAYWSGVMTLTYPDRIAASWLRSGAPPLTPIPDRPTRMIIGLPEETLEMPIMFNLGTEEGVTVKEGRFAVVWPAVQNAFEQIRSKGGLAAIAVDPLTGHACGNQRYLAIPWFDECLAARLPAKSGEPMGSMSTDSAWLAPSSPDPIGGTQAVPASKYDGDAGKAIWLPSERIARAWMQYIRNTKVFDNTAPPSPTNVKFADGVLTWDSPADLESGLWYFIISRNGKPIVNVPQQARNPHGRPVFQGLQYSDTPEQPLVKMKYVDPQWKPGDSATYHVTAVNTVGLLSQ